MIGRVNTRNSMRKQWQETGAEMARLTEAVVTEGLAVVEEIYGTPVTELRIKAWFAACQVLSCEQFESALMAHVRDPVAGKFTPKPADLIGAGMSDAIETAVGNALARIESREFWQYHPEGSRYDLAAMECELGADGVAAFREAGGDYAFGGASGKVADRAWAAKQFQELYRDRLKAKVQAGRLEMQALPGSPRKALPRASVRLLGE